MYVKTDARGRKRSTVDVSHLTDGSPASLYVLGLLFANYSVSTARSEITGAYVSGRVGDMPYTDRLVEYMGFKIKQQRKAQHDYAITSIPSIALVDHLEALGCVQLHKDRVANEQLAGSALFWRGFVDGNGSYSEGNLHIQGGLPIVKQFVGYLRNLVSLERADRKEFKRYIELRLYGETALQTIQHLYTGTFEDRGIFLAMPHMLTEIKEAMVIPSIPLYVL